MSENQFDIQTFLKTVSGQGPQGFFPPGNEAASVASGPTPPGFPTQGAYGTSTQVSIDALFGKAGAAANEDIDAAPSQQQAAINASEHLLNLLKDGSNANIKESDAYENAAASGLGLGYPLTERDPSAQGAGSPSASVAFASATAAAAAVAAAAAAGAAPQTVPVIRPAVGRPLPDPHMVYDIGSDRDELLQPQLEVSPITMYNSEFNLSLGRQISVNKHYICYGLKTGQIRILNMFTAVRALLRGHQQPVADLRFFADDVDLLGSASKDGRVFIRRIKETPGTSGQTCNTINEQLLLTLVLQNGKETGGRLVRFCWHTSQENIFAVAAGGSVVVCQMDVLASADPSGAPVEFSLQDPPAGALLLSADAGPVTDIAFSPQGDTLASAGEDGIVRVWRVAQDGGECLIEMSPFQGMPTYSILWAPAPHEPTGVVLITGNIFNHEIKLWQVVGEFRGLRCLQTVTLQSEDGAEESFFNHALFETMSSVLMLANTKKNALYALRLAAENPGTPCFSCIAEFSVTMPILSFTSISEPAKPATPEEPEEKPMLALYCVQTSAIQQYMLDCNQCAPTDGAPRLPSIPVPNPPVTQQLLRKADPPEEEEDLAAEKRDSEPAQPGDEVDPAPEEEAEEEEEEEATEEAKAADAAPAAEEILSELAAQNLLASVMSATVQTAKADEAFQLPDTADTPSASAAEDLEHAVAQVEASEASREPEGEVKAPTDEEAEPPADFAEEAPPGTDTGVPEAPEGADIDAYITSPNMDPAAPPPTPLVNAQMEPPPPPLLITPMQLIQQARANFANLELDSPHTPENETSEPLEAGAATPSGLSAPPPEVEAPAMEVAVVEDEDEEPLSPHALKSVPVEEPAAMESVEQLADIVEVATQRATAPMLLQMQRMEESVASRLQSAMQAELASQREFMQQQMHMQWAMEKERQKQLLVVMSQTINRDLPLAFEKILERHLSTLAPALTHAVVPAVNNALLTVNKALVEKALPNMQSSLAHSMEHSVTTALSRDLGHVISQPLHEAFRRSFEESLLPAFEGAAQSMFSQINTTFNQGLEEHMQKASVSPSHLAQALHESISTAATLTDALAEEREKLAHMSMSAAHRLAADASTSVSDPQAESGAIPPPGGPSFEAMEAQAVSLEQLESKLDPTIQIQKLLQEQQYEQAFNKALTLSDVTVVAWLIAQLKAEDIFSMTPPPLSQGVLLSLVQQVSCAISTNEDLSEDKLEWLQQSVLALDPHDALLAPHMKPILQQLFDRIQPMLLTGGLPSNMNNTMRVLVHLVKSLIGQCL
ncbi:hypothetical protein CYMTET_40532 [Cymbomonas tetramitiformis]|uniref:Enhancer of mRNA-decapping protein 4 WD40 repeat region domain-containing protein n=1 Tax=Cymbomonas tetramitiformis TaxID=36881 RepID=A0AAE0C9N6_9CHLO|nr:hypothetical protein CYMTET_40532 [Cymbomonas tetramitiformis]